MLPYDDVVIEAMVAGKTVVEYSDGKISEDIRSVWDEIMNVLFRQEKKDLVKLVQ